MMSPMKAAKRPGFLLLVWLLAPVWLAGTATQAPAVAAAGPSPTFLSTLDDVPLMPGLAERKDLAVTFDKAEGRIVEAVAEGRMGQAEVAKFYATTLPQLGWKGEGNNRFAREGEELLLNFSAAANKLTVRFALSPKR
jgi:hypothetical protein